MKVLSLRQSIEFSRSKDGKKSKKPHRWDGESNPRWARDGRVVIGQQFGSWTVLSDAPFQLYGALYVMCRCRCGREKEVSLRMMEMGRSTMCKGCATTEMHHRNGKLVVDTLEKKLLQKRVSAMRQRCQNPRDQSYQNYGGRGIQFKFDSVKSGVDYILDALPAASYVGLDIDRTDNNGHYEPGNLRLVTRKANHQNKRPTISLTPDLEIALVLGLALCITANTERQLKLSFV